MCPRPFKHGKVGRSEEIFQRYGRKIMFSQATTTQRGSNIVDPWFLPLTFSEAKPLECRWLRSKYPPLERRRSCLSQFSSCGSKPHVVPCFGLTCLKDTCSLGLDSTGIHKPETDRLTMMDKYTSTTDIDYRLWMIMIRLTDNYAYNHACLIMLIHIQKPTLVLLKGFYLYLLKGFRVLRGCFYVRRHWAAVAMFSIPPAHQPSWAEGACASWSRLARRGQQSGLPWF